MIRSRRPFTFAAMLAVAAPLALGACTTNRATGEQSFTAFMSEEDELRVGAEEHPKMLKEFGGAYSDAQLEALVASLGRKLAAVSELPNLQFHFTVLNDKTVNAFALPGGYVYVSRGLIALCEDEAELAGVVAHEIGHVTARHTAERYSHAVAANLGLTALGVVGSVLGVPSGVGNLASFGAQAALQSYSRSQEMQADFLGVRYMTRAGYDPHALTSFFAKLDAHTRIEAEKEGRPADNFSVMSTHPRTADRIQQAARLAETSMPKDAIRGRGPFLDKVDGVIFGEDPKQGFVRDSDFIHPDLGFRFTFPPGMRVDNTPSKVVATDGQGTTIVFDAENPKVASGMGDLRDYLRRTWGAKLALSGVEQLDINGLEAATGQARAGTNQGPRDIRLVAIRLSRDHLYRFMFVTTPQATGRMSDALRRTTYSFRGLTKEEANSILPPRIRVTSVRAGDTPATFFANMPLGRFNEAWFNALNLNVVADGLAPGERVKIVTK